MKIRHLGALILGFLGLSPLVTFGLLWAKGLPDFAAGHLDQVVLWVYSMTWAPALLTGIVLAALVYWIVGETKYFHQPYDFGRSFSLGAVLGCIVQGGATLGYRALTLYPLSDFWVAGALIGGCLTGALLVPLILSRTSSRLPTPAKAAPAHILWASRIFKGAGIYGLIALLPQYLLEQKIGIDHPPPITHPEYFYGFIGVGVAWQALFLVIAKDPVRYRAAIPAGILEKVAFGMAVLFLYAQGRTEGLPAFFACVDLCLSALFFAAYRRIPVTK